MLTKFLITFLLLELVAAVENFIFSHGFNTTDLSLNGTAEIASGGLLQLTNNTDMAAGRAFHPSPIHFKNSDGKPMSFSTTFVFAIVPEYKDVSGHGMTFALSPTKEPLYTIQGPYFGLFNNTNTGQASNHIIAVELDTAQQAPFGDIDDDHVGIDVNGIISSNSSHASYLDDKHQLIGLHLTSGDPMQVWVDYSGKDMRIDVRIAPAGVSRPSHPLVSSKLDISTIVLDNMYVGFTATTGEGTAFHYVLGWSFSLGGKARDLDLSKLPSVPRPDEIAREGMNILALVLPLVASIMVLIAVTGGILVARRRKKFAEVLEDWELEYGPHRFKYKDLFKATRGFDEQQILGAGGFGSVYKGVMPTSKLKIAVKKISHQSRQGMKEFVAEIASMGRLRHRNLVQLLGYCRRQGELLLVYEFMPNGSLDKMIFGESKTVLGWGERFRVIKGVASGLVYLHDGWEQVVIHRDIKAANVMLDHDLNGKLGDFGLAKLYDHGSNPQTTHIVGTLGYLAPDLSDTGKATVKTDVFAFGAFLLEVACGRRPIQFLAPTPILVDWVLDLWKRGEILKASDPNLGSDYSVREMELVLKLGSICSHHDPAARPSMRQVTQFLDGDAPFPATSFGYPHPTPQACEVVLDDFIMSYPSSPSNPFATHIEKSI